MNKKSCNFRKVLITGCAGDIAIAISRILREAQIFEEIWGCDINPTGACEYYFDKCLKVSPAKSNTWFTEFEGIVLNNDFDLVIPTVEHELAELIRFDVTHLNLMMVAKDILACCLDKYKTAQFLNDNSLGVANTKLLTDSSFDADALIIKPRSGRGSQGLHIVKTVDEFNFVKAKLENDHWVSQKLLKPAAEEYTCGVFRSSSGIIRTIVMRRTLKNGMTGSGTVEKNAQIDQLLNQTANAFGLIGAFNIQCILTEDGPIIFEINPRFSSTVRFRHLLGYNDLIWSILDRCNMDLPPYIGPKAGTRFVRAHEEILL